MSFRSYCLLQHFTDLILPVLFFWPIRISSIGLRELLHVMHPKFYLSVQFSLALIWEFGFLGCCLPSNSYFLELILCSVSHASHECKSDVQCSHKQVVWLSESSYLLYKQQELMQTGITLAPVAPSLLLMRYTVPLYISHEKLWKIYGNSMCAHTYLLKPKP